MKRADSEDSVLGRFRQSDILIISRNQREHDELKQILGLVIDDWNWCKWTHNFGKADYPPDFFSEELGIMMEVMSVDDRAFEDAGKVINKTKAAESQMYKKLEESFRLDDDVMMAVLGSSDLPYDEDHNYSRYVSNVHRVVDKHKGKIDLYTTNHPNCKKLIFFIYDESTPYIVNKKPTHNPKIGQHLSGRIHKYYADEMMLRCFDDDRVDYIIWYAPYKVYLSQTGHPVPYVTAIIMSGRNHPIGNKYPKSKMVSVEM